MATDGRLSDLVAELRAGGEVDSHGRFTLDRAQAREKMQKFQLDDARRYVLELVQAALLRGAQGVSFSIDADDMRMSFGGRPFTQAELEDLWGSIFADGDAADLRGVRQLALGLNAALGLDPRRIVVRSGGHELRLVPGRDEVVTAIDPPATGTTIHVKKRLGLGLMVEWLKDMSGAIPEELYLRAHCRYARVPIILDDKPIAAGLKIEQARLEVPIEGPGVRGVIGLVEGAATAELRLIKDGVWIDSHPLEGVGPGIVAVVEGEQLRKDVSMAKIVADDALEQIAGLARVARWALLARLIAAGPIAGLDPALVMPRVRGEVLQYLKLRDLRKRPEAAALARAITWVDVRTCSEGHVPTVTLEQLAGAVTSEGGARELRHAVHSYPALRAEGPPIPRIVGAEVAAVGRVLACTMVAVDQELARAQRREQGRLEWRRREMSPRLPTSRSYLVRAPIEGPEIRGELGITEEAVGAGGAPHGRIWAIALGCLVTQIEVDWGVPGLDLAVEADFSIAELFDDVARDAALVEVVLRALAALPGPLADLVEGTAETSLAPGVRGLVKAWLLLALDAGRRAEVWQHLGVPEPLRPDATAVQKWLPSAPSLRRGEGRLAALTQVPLFEDFDGARRSLGELVRRHAQRGEIEFIERSVPRVPELGREVAWLGKGDCKIVAGLLGEAALRSWAPTLQQHRRALKFRAQPERSILEAANEANEALRSTGLDPGLWCHIWMKDGVQLVLTLQPPPGFTAARESPGPARIELLLEGRRLVTRSVPLGFAPMWGTATAKSLRPNSSWDDVASDDSLAPLVKALVAAAWALVDGLVGAHRRGGALGEARWAWLRGQVIGRLAECSREEVLAATSELQHAPLFATLDRKLLSLAQIDEVVARHGHIAWVPTSTPGASLGGPPIVREEPEAIEALDRWVGATRLVDGGERVRAHRLQRRLSDLPPVTALTLDPAGVWAKVSLGSDGSPIAGEVGLRRVDAASTLRIEVCMDGRKIGEFVHEDAPAPLVAIACDPQLPLTADGEVDTRSKRYAHLLRRCRRAATGMIEALCQRFAALPAEECAPARALLLAYAARRARQSARDGSQPGRGVEAVRALPLLVDVWGRTHTPEEIEARGGDSIDVVRWPVEPPPVAAQSERLILVADEPALAYLEAIGPVNLLDRRWDEELAAIRALIEAPQCTLPDLREVAWIDRRATIAGGLQAHLWIPRKPALTDCVSLTRGERELGRVSPVAALPCAGIVRGEALRGGPGTVALDAKQRISLAKQVCRLYESLAKQVRSGGRLDADARTAATAWLLGADEALSGLPAQAASELGKPLKDLQAALAELAPPAVRRARAKAEEEQARKRAEQAESEARRLAAQEAAIAATRTITPPPGVPQTTAKPAPAKAGPEALPEYKLLALVREELEWARARHGSLLERLRLDRLAIGTGREPGIARFDQGIVLQGRHPLIARALTRLTIGEAPDPVDMMFVLANVYTLMNEVSAEIVADDEQAFVARLAEGLAAGLG